MRLNNEMEFMRRISISIWNRIKKIILSRKNGVLKYFCVNNTQLYIGDRHNNIQKRITEKSIDTFVHSLNNSVQKKN